MAQEVFLDEPVPDIIEQWRFYLSILAPAPGDMILDVGCHTGDAERLLVREYPEIRCVIGVDIARSKCSQAINRCVCDGRPGQIRFAVADGRRLPFRDDSIDRAFCMESLEWIREPRAALKAIHRVLKPSGTAVIVHSDFDTQIFHAADKVLSRHIVLAFSDSGPNGQIGRELVGLCRQAGFASVRPIVHTVINTNWHQNMYAYRMVRMMRDWLTTKGLIRVEDLDRWVSDLEARAGDGSFFYSINRNICHCVK